MFRKIEKEKAPHYIWGDNCDGWIFADTNELSVKQEAMPAGTEEQHHYHSAAQQFFFILKGTATFYIKNEKVEITAQQGIVIPPMARHYISNETDTPIEFLVVSQPSTNTDRINLE